jgi:hypothetical protein
VGIVDEPVAAGVSEGGVTDDSVPVLGLQLAGEDGGAELVAVVEHFERLLALSSPEGLQAEVVEDEDLSLASLRNRWG